MLFSQLKTGDKAKVIKLTGGKEFRKRVSEMGLVKGAVFRIKTIAPLGDPIEIEIKGYKLSIRKSEATNILVEKINYK